MILIPKKVLFVVAGNEMFVKEVGGAGGEAPAKKKYGFTAEPAEPAKNQAPAAPKKYGF